MQNLARKMSSVDVNLADEGEDSSMEDSILKEETPPMTSDEDSPKENMGENPSIASPSTASPSIESPSIESPSIAGPSIASPSIASLSIASPSVASPSVATVDSHGQPYDDNTDEKTVEFLDSDDEVWDKNEPKCVVKEAVENSETGPQVAVASLCRDRQIPVKGTPKVCCYKCCSLHLLVETCGLTIAVD